MFILSISYIKIYNTHTTLYETETVSKVDGKIIL